MSAIEAKNILSKLRSNGVKVQLRPRGAHPGEVVFTGLGDATPAVRLEVVRLGVYIQSQLQKELEVRQTRELAKTKLNHK